MLRGTDLGTRLILSSNQAARTFREWLLPIAAALPPARRQLLATISELNVGYPKSPLSIAADLPRDSLRFLERVPGGLDPGQRVPNGTLSDPQTGEPISLFDLIARGWLMLLFPDRSGSPTVMAAQNDAAHQVRATVGDAVQTFVVVGSLPAGDMAAPGLIDGDGAIARLFGASHGLVALIRPDGYLGYRSLPGQPLELASYLARVFSLRLPGPRGPSGHHPMTVYDLYLESGPRRRKTMVHVPSLLGCVATGATTEEALANTPAAIQSFLRSAGSPR